MNNYDFRSLNDKEFEALACDLLGEHLGRKFERFKAGKDAGVDGRFFLSDDQEVVLQCKHWPNTPIAQLINKFSKSERPKVAKLKPAIYYVAVTNNLSRKDKTKIKIALSPYIKNESFIYGAEDLNDLLGSANDIERRHYKLWLHSSSVLSHMMNHAIVGRSEHTFEEIRADTARYAITENHRLALAQLENLGVIIVTGEPGIGKTTLANHLCLNYIAQGYELVVVSDDIKEAENILNDDSRQIFYFDDFLGRNYLEALNGHEGKKITQFIKRIARNSNKKFVLTSRSTILNQGKLLIDVLAHDNLQRNEYEMKIASLSDIDKAHILYNQIWHSQLDPAHVKEIYEDKRYRQIISHKNYNPRLINYVTDAGRIGNMEADVYWNFVLKSLNNPADIWDNPFVAQQDDFGRAIVLLVVINRQPIGQHVLSKAYHDYMSLPGSQNMKGRPDFISNLKTLTGSFLNRLVDESGVRVDLFNPSIGDYVLERYRNDPSTLKLAFVSLLNSNSLHTLKSLRKNELIRAEDCQSTANAMLERVVQIDFSGVGISFVAELLRYIEKFPILERRVINFLKDGCRYILERTEATNSTRDAFSVVKFGVERKWVEHHEALSFVDRLVHFVVADEEIEDCFSLMRILRNDDENYNVLWNKAINEISDHIEQDFSRFIDVGDAFAECNVGDYECAYQNIVKLLEQKLCRLGLDPEDFDLNCLVQDLDVKVQLDQYFKNSVHISIPRQLSDTPIAPSESQIDDLFERS